MVYLKVPTGGKSFIQKTDGLVKAMYTCISSDAKTQGKLYTAARRTGSNKNIPLIPIYMSKDNGESWQLLNAQPSQSDFCNFPSFVKNFEWVGFAISKIKVDIVESDRLFISNWWGVSVSNDSGKTWNGNWHKGTETQCIDNVITDPLNTDKVYFSVCDHNVFTSEDNGKNYHSLPKPESNTHLNTSSVACPSHFKADFILYGITERNGAPMGLVKGAAIVRSVDGGKTSEVVKYFSEKHFVQAIKEDFREKGKFYAYIDGDMKSEGGIYCTEDWGTNWKKLNSPFPDYLTCLPFHRNWIESELLPVVYYQVKNNCGTNQLLCVDPFRKNTIYAGEYTEGLFCSTNDGQTWQNISANLPFKKDTASALVDIKADENRPGVIYAGFVREGLWRTNNYGKTWSKIFPLDNSIFNATSTVVGGVTKNELFMVCEPLFWSNSSSVVLYSPDNGKTWQNIVDKTLGAIRWKSIAVNKKTGTIHAVASGNGCFYAERKK